MKFPLHFAACALLRGVRQHLAAPLVLFAFCAGTPARAEEVVCHYTYGGETETLVAAPTSGTAAYAVAGTEVGSYFLFRALLQEQPKDVAAVKVYTYAKRDESLVLIHEAVYPYPPAARRAHAPYGFTGLHFIYEPMREGELQYWCELRPRARGTKKGQPR